MKLIVPLESSKYKLLMNNSHEIILFFDDTGRIIDCNKKAAEELGYGADILRLHINDIFKNVCKNEDGTLKIEPQFLYTLHETVAYRRNQTCFAVELSIAKAKKHRNFIGMCTAINITDKKEGLRENNALKNELNNYNQISSELVAKIAHELRTPVNGILGFSNNLLDTELKPDQSEAINIIKRCCMNMNTTINDLLDYAKISNRKLIIEQREFSFSEFIRHIVDINLIHINKKGLKLSLSIADDIPDRLIGDEHRLSQILNNLFSNAIKFTPSGQINLEVVKAAQSEEYIELFFMLIDTGIGISREEKDKLFKSFSQVDGSITRRFGGTGLGLSICKRLVEAMHGTIEVDSEKNKGSNFSFSVRLGLPKKSNKIYFNSDEMLRGLNLNNIVNVEKTEVTDETGNISDMDYISQRLQDIAAPVSEFNSISMQKALADMNDLVDKLAICIEMDNWEETEEIANRIKNIVPMDHLVKTNIIFRLLLAVRKENHDASLSIIDELRVGMHKEI